MLQIYLIFIIKQHIFYDTYTMNLMYDEIEQKNGWESLFENRDEKTKHMKNNLIKQQFSFVNKLN